MKTFLSALSGFFLLSAVTIKSQSEWLWQNPQPTGKFRGRVKFNSCKEKTRLFLAETHQPCPC
jgi:hypothetical protein